MLSNLDKVVDDLSKSHDCSVNDIGIIIQPNGLIALVVQEKTVEWFFNEIDLLVWLENYDNENKTTRPGFTGEIL